MEILSKEDFLGALFKMDAVSATGVWLAQFPALSHTGRLHYAAGLYWQLLQMESHRRGRKVETSHERRLRLMQSIEDRIAREEEDDLFTLLTL